MNHRILPIFLLGLSLLVIHSVHGYAVPDNTLSVIGLKQESGVAATSSDEEIAFVEFMGNNDNYTLDSNDDGHSHGGVGGFFKRLGCDIVKGTQIVSKSVSEGKVWNSVKKGFEKVKNFFSKKKVEEPVPETEAKEVPVIKAEAAPVPETEQVAKELPVIKTEAETVPETKAKEVPVSQTEAEPSVTVTSSAPTETIPEDNEVSSGDPAPDIDVRMLGATGN